jgi:hypothetical protein
VLDSDVGAEQRVERAGDVPGPRVSVADAVAFTILESAKSGRSLSIADICVVIAVFGANVILWWYGFKELPAQDSASIA